MRKHRKLYTVQEIRNYFTDKDSIDMAIAMRDDYEDKIEELIAEFRKEVSRLYFRVYMRKPLLKNS